MQSIGKIPPQDIKAEETVLGAILVERRAIEEVAGLLKAESFYKEANAEIYSAMSLLYSIGEPIDLVTLTNQLRKKGKLELVGGPYYLASLQESIISSDNIDYHAKIIAEMYIKRRLIQIGHMIYSNSYDHSSDCFELLSNTQQELINLLNSVDVNQASHIREIVSEVMTDIGHAMTLPEGITGIPSGFNDIDKITGGWQNGNLIIIGARPAMGKTAFLVNALRNAAVIHKKPVAIFSLEMTKKQIVTRMIAGEVDELELSTDRLFRGKISEQELSTIHKRINGLIQSDIIIDDTSGLSINDFRIKLTKLKSKYNIQIAAVDYIQLMHGHGKGNREQDVSSISRGLKVIAKDLNIPIIALSQLSRSLENRPDKRPQLADLRESGSLEQDADMVAFLYRPEYYKIMEDEAGNDLRGLGQFIIAKHRNGSLEDIVLRFVSRKTKFYNMHEYPEVNSVQNFDNSRNFYQDEDDEPKF